MYFILLDKLIIKNIFFRTVNISTLLKNKIHTTNHAIGELFNKINE